MRRPALLLVALLASCAASEERLVVDVRVNGAVNRAGSYVAEPRGSDGCSIWISPYPAIVPGQPVVIAPPTYIVSVNGYGQPPGDVFLLFAPGTTGMRQVPLPNPAIRLTAGERLWETNREGGSVSSVVVAEGSLSGTFWGTGLRPADGGPERLDVEGRWRCPARP